MREFLRSFESETPWPLAEARELLNEAQASEPIPNRVEVDSSKAFDRRYDLAQYLHQRIPRLELSDPFRDTGLWAWLALLWFEQLCPSGKPGKQYRYIPDFDNWQTYYRHLVFGPYAIYNSHRANPERALCMLCQPPAIHPDTAEQLFGRQDMIQSPALVGIATVLYYDPSKAKVVTGATYNRKPFKPGTLRRLVDVFWQFDRTYDHLASSIEAFMGLLPAEFEHFKRSA